MKVIRAENAGMCFGVRDAIELARETARHHSLTVLGDLVHNKDVVQRLQSWGIRMEREVAGVGTPTVMTTAHGVSEKRLADLRGRGLGVVESTCPLVRVAHRALKDLVEAGYHPVVVGVRGHVEVRGLVEDYPEADVILSADDVAALSERRRYGVVAQTTQPLERVWRLADLIRHRFPGAEVKVMDTVCRPTKLRQWDAERLGRTCELVVVVGGPKSNNTGELAETCRRGGARVERVERAEELRVEWFVGVRVVGLTAGTSTPDDVVDRVEEKLRELGEEVRRGMPAHAIAGRVMAG